MDHFWEVVVMEKERMQRMWMDLYWEALVTCGWTSCCVVGL